MRAINQNHSTHDEYVDFDLHGLVGIRLINPSPRDAAAVARQLGPIQAKLSREPDIVIRFVETIKLSSPMRLLGLDDSGFTDDGFFVLRSRFKAKAKVKIALDKIGKQCEIICESGLPGVPLLIPILNLTLLSRGAIPLHASAFTYNGAGVVVTGWSKGGKTETLLSFVANGAKYVGDEWVILTADGLRMYGIPEPIRVWDWHLQYLPQFRRMLNRSDHYRLRAIRFAQAMYRLIPNASRSDFLPITVLRRAMLLLERQLCVDVAPRRLFGGNTCAISGKPEVVIFAMSHDSPEVKISRIDPNEIVRRMVFSLRYEQLDFFEYYMKFRFAFPDLANDLIDKTSEYQFDLLSRALAGKEAYTLLHPYPVPLTQIFEAIRPLLREAPFRSQPVKTGREKIAERNFAQIHAD
jgi:hypothetical protein